MRSLHKKMPKVLFIASDCPSYYVDTIHAMAGQLTAKGFKTLFAVTTSYYEQFRGLKLEIHGDVKYFSEYLDTFPVEEDLRGVSIDYWKIYPTFIRYRYYHGSHDNDWGIYKKIVLFYRDLFDEYDIDLVVAEPPSNAFLYLAYEEAKRRGVPYFGFMPARVPGYYNIFLDAYGEKLLKNPTPPVQLEEDQGIIEYMENPVNDLSNVSTIKFLTAKTNRFIDALQIDAKPSVETGETFKLQLHSYWIMIRRKLRHWKFERIDKIFESSIDFEQHDVTILFPLQYRPEASSSVLARYYSDDIEVIKNIAFSKNSNAALYVKEHPAAIGIRDGSFYKEILSYPRVHLLHPAFQLRTHLYKFDAVVTLTSTVGFEALQVGVPVLLLGRAFFSGYPGVTAIESFSMLNECLKSIGPNHNRTANPEVLLRYLQFCMKGSFNYVNQNIVAPINITNLIEPIVQKLSG